MPRLGDRSANMAPVDGYRPSTYGDAFADVYDEWYGDVTPADETARFLADRAGGPVVELGSGTGRLAGAIRAAGIDVVGLDASLAMLGAARTAHADIPAVAADMAAPPFADACAGAVLIAFNTLFNLPTPDAQRRALERAGEIVRHDGIVVVEAFVPGAGASEVADHVDVVRMSAGAVVLRISRTEPDPDDPDAGTVHGHHAELRDGAPVRLRPWQVRYTSPRGLDRLAADAGLVLRDRYGDWRGGPFGPACDVHVSVYQRSETHR